MTLPSPELRGRARAALQLDDDALEAECELQFFIAGGPGGQHRNKTQSAVRLIHLPTGTTLTATERRSQAHNRAVALERLRERLLQLSIVPRIRRPTKPSKAQRRSRVESKRRTSDKKKARRVSPADL